MVELQCPVDGCTYVTPTGSSENIACTLLHAHSTIHMNRVPPTTTPRGPKLDRPKVDIGINQEEWNIFIRRWDAFVIGSGIDPVSCSTQLFQCAGASLGDSLLKSSPSILSRTTADLLSAMKSLAVIAIATGVIRAELMAMKQDRDEQFRSFAARVRGKADTCNYSTKCVCTRTVDFTDSIIRDVLIAGIDDTDIRREILSTEDILEKPVNDIIALVESKEMARNTLPHPSNISSSTYRRQKSNKSDAIVSSNRTQTVPCPDCGKPYHLFSEGRSGWNSKPHRQCLECYRLNAPSRSKRRHTRKDKPEAESPSTVVNSVFAQVSTISDPESSFHEFDQTAVNVAAHKVFTKGGWRKSRFMDHPTVTLSLSVCDSDYRQFGQRCPNISSTKVTALADSGAQSCLWSLQEFHRAGFTLDDLVPISIDLMAANKSPITVMGAIPVRLWGDTSDKTRRTCATMVYISRQVKGFYLSLESMMDLGIVTTDFPNIGVSPQLKDGSSTPQHPSISHILNAGCSEPTNGTDKLCSCPARTRVPDLPRQLPFECLPANNTKMQKWLLDYFASSTFNTCPHHPLPHMTGPPVEIHMKENTTPKAIHIPASIPIHWQEQVRKDLLRDEALGVIEKVPYGEPVTWCHRMVVTRKHDGTPRRTVDLSPLNKFCKRETFASVSPFQSARRIPPNTWKTVSDAWNGFHSVPLRPSDRHLTTFITPFGRWRYITTPQGFVGSGDGYNRRFDAVLSDFARKERVTDDTIHYDQDLNEHWWRTIKSLIRVGQSGIILNPDKFQFAQKTVDFAGFRVSDTNIEPLPKYLDAIRRFPIPRSTTDIRSWFGLVNQVSNYAQLRDIMAPFKPFLSPKCTFNWTPELDSAFTQSKESIVAEIKHGVEIFDPTKRTCLRPDWSSKGLGYFLLQKHCSCGSEIPDCCTDGWKIILAGSRFLLAAEQRYAPIEGECLAVAWGLEQTKYFTQGCQNLIVVTDHKPLVKILGDRTLDEISNTRIFRLKQRTLPWSFDIAHLPGKTNTAADATSRHPSNIPTQAIEPDDPESIMAASIQRETNEYFSLSWEHIAEETAKDPMMCRLIEAIEHGFQDIHRYADIKVSEFWKYRESLHVLDDVIIYQDRVVIPTVLRDAVLRILHSANQGVSAMESRARATVFWPGMTKDIQSVRDNCHSCHRNAPSQAALPSTQMTVPSTPFESIFADFFTFSGHHYLLAGDRLSGWVEVFKAPNHTKFAGAKGLVSSLRSLFATFGVPDELSSDGGPEFEAATTSTFLKNWGVRHRVSSAYFPQSNGRAEVAVKKCKRLLMDNISPDGSLDNDCFLRALLQVRNTPDPDCNISPAEIIFGRPIRDAFSFVNRLTKFKNPSIRPIWREAWMTKEDAMRTRFSRTSERLDRSSRPLPALSTGDRVFIQNQHGNHPTKWDKSGTVVEVKDHDQYVTKVDGSGRLTLRNRRFLRKFVPPSINIPHGTKFCPRNIVHRQLPQSSAYVCSNPTVPEYLFAQPDTAATTPDSLVACPPEGPNHSSPSSRETVVFTPVDTSERSASNPSPARIPDVISSETNCGMPRPVSSPLIPVASSPTAALNCPDDPSPTVLRTRRCVRAPRKYVPETGLWE